MISNVGHRKLKATIRSYQYAFFEHLRITLRASRRKAEPTKNPSFGLILDTMIQLVDQLEAGGLADCGRNNGF